MPPLKTYIFENKTNDKISVTVKAYNPSEAVNRLGLYVKDISQFRMLL